MTRRGTCRLGVAEPFSGVGAGDTVVTAFAFGIAAGLSPVAAAALANDAAGVVVQQPGTHAVSRAELVP